MLIFKRIPYFLAALLFLAAINVHSAENYQYGRIKDLTAVIGGVMIKLDADLPTVCEGTPYGWMLVKQEHTALVSVVLTAWASGNKSGTVYVSGLDSQSRYCLVNQFDPSN